MATDSRAAALAAFAAAERHYDVDVPQAQADALQALAHARAAEDAPLAARAWALWGVLSVRQPALGVARAEQDLHTAMREVEQLGPVDARAGWLLDDGRAYMALRHGRPDDAFRAAWRAFQAPPEERSPMERDLTLRALGLATLARGDFAESLRFRHLALLMARSTGRPAAIARALHSVGHWHETQFNLDDALAAFEESHALWRQIWPRGRLKALSTVTLIHVLGLAEQTDRAYELLQQWLQQPGGVEQDNDRLLDWSAEVAQALLNVGRADEAKVYLDMGNKPTFMNPRRPVLWVQAQAAWLLAKGQPETARQLCQQHLDEAATSGRILDPLTRSQLYELIGRASDAQDDAVGAAAAARATRDLLIPLIGQSARAQYMTLKVTCDPQAAELLTGLDNSRLAAIERTVQHWQQSESRAAAPSRGERKWLAQLTHDMRSPLNGVMGLTSLLLMSKLDAQQRHLAELTQRSAGSLLRLVNDILDLARSDAGRLSIEPSAFDLHQLLHDMADIGRALTPESVQFALQIDPGVPSHIVSDPARIVQVLHNLLSNAVKATERGEVRLHAQMLPADTQGPRRLRLSVSDTGQGISEADQARLFSEFAQLGPAPVQGTGLGLSLARNLAELLGGHLAYQSALGRGSAFWFELPIQESELAEAA